MISHFFPGSSWNEIIEVHIACLSPFLSWWWHEIRLTFAELLSPDKNDAQWDAARKWDGVPCAPANAWWSSPHYKVFCFWARRCLRCLSVHVQMSTSNARLLFQFFFSIANASYVQYCACFEIRMTTPPGITRSAAPHLDIIQAAFQLKNSVITYRPHTHNDTMTQLHNDTMRQWDNYTMTQWDNDILKTRRKRNFLEVKNIEKTWTLTIELNRKRFCFK